MNTVQNITGTILAVIGVIVAIYLIIHIGAYYHRERAARRDACRNRPPRPDGSDQQSSDEDRS